MFDEIVSSNCVLCVMLGVAEIFKTPANTRSKNRVPVNNACLVIPLDEISVMKTPEESGKCFRFVSQVIYSVLV